jgi:hypothetical protein
MLYWYLDRSPGSVKAVGNKLEARKLSFGKIKNLKSRYCTEVNGHETVT